MFLPHRTFQLFSLTVIAALLVPELVQHGMFMDGMQYACVSKNLAEGQGSFWFPYLSSSWSRMDVTAFLEHPPLVYFLQSLFFSCLGHGFYVEKLYGLVMALICAYLICRIWRLITASRPSLGPYWWLAVLLWFITPSVFWSFRNNMMENTVSVFVLAASYFAIKALLKEGRALPEMILAGLFIFLGSLCKGLPALFPLCVPVCFYISTPAISLKRVTLYSCLLAGIPALIYGLLWLCDTAARQSLGFYIQNRMLDRISNDPTVGNRFTILYWLLCDLLVSLGLALLLFCFPRFRSFHKITAGQRSLILFFLLLGFCGVLPLCLTRVQRATYFVPAIPFFSVAFALFLSEGLSKLLDALPQRALKLMRRGVWALLIAVLAYALSLSGKNCRDEALLSDVNRIGAYTGKNKTLDVPFEVYTRWNFQFYLLRYYNDVLATGQGWREDYLVFEKGKMPGLPAGYRKTELELNYFVLCVKD